MISVFEGITVSFVILELAAFVVLFWRSMNEEPYRHWPRFQPAGQALPESRGVSD